MRTSPLLSGYSESEFLIGDVAAMRIAVTRRDAATNLSTLADLSCLRKILVIGSGAAAWLAHRQLPVPPLLTRVATPGQWVAQLNARQYLVSEDLDSVGSFEFERGDSEVCLIAADWVELALRGPMTDDLLSELCPTQLAQYPTSAWIPTLLAEAEVAIHRGEGPQHYRVLCAPAEGPYVFSTLARLTGELGGIIIGFEDYRRLKRGAAQGNNEEGEHA